MNSWLQLAQLEIRERQGGTCEANNGFCPDWIADNFNRYVDPFLQHVFLVVVSVAIGFVIAFFLALLAHRKRWLLPALSARPRSCTRSPASRCSSCCCPSPAAER